jgi:hypothetical protein
LVGIAPGLKEIRAGLEKKPTQRQLEALPARTDSFHSITYRRIRKPQTAIPASAVRIDPQTALRHGQFYPCGSSISAADYNSTGTIGCLVEADGVIYGLTNNHVTGGCGQTETDMPILAPGLFDITGKNLAPFTIGRHAKSADWVIGAPQDAPIGENLDLALFKIEDLNKVTSFQGNYFDTPTKVAKTSDLMKAPRAKIQKVGLTTGLTTGFLFNKLAGIVEIQMTGKNFRNPVFFNKVFIVEDAPAQPFALAGDSGSLAIWQNQGQSEAVGIVFSVNPSDNVAFLLPMEEVLNYFHVGIVGNYNV